MATNPNELTEAQLSEIWKNDRLNRREDAEFLAKFLLARVENRRKRELDASYVLNIDASWGRGKTFFLNNFAEQLKQQGYIVAEVNAWRDDYSDDPFLSVMSAVSDAIKPLIAVDENKKKLWSSVKQNSAAIAIAAGKGLVKQFAKKIFGEGVEEISSLVASDEDPNNNSPSATEVAVAGIGSGIESQANQYFEQIGDQLLDGFNKEKQSAAEFRSSLGDLLSGTKIGESSTPMFIMIDELDRCRPPYAIAMLERIKHLFDIDNIVFMIATDTAQLRHSIKAVYGQNFDSAGYLNRFFYRSYELPTPSFENFVKDLLVAHQIDCDTLSIPPNDEFPKYFSDAFHFFGFELRDIEQFFEILDNIATFWDDEIKIELAYLLPLIVAFQRKISLDQPTKIFDLLEKRSGLVSVRHTWKSNINDGFSKDMESAKDVFEIFCEIQHGLLNAHRVISWQDSKPWIGNKIELRATYAQRDPIVKLPASYLAMKNYPSLIKMAGRLAKLEK